MEEEVLDFCVCFARLNRIAGMEFSYMMNTNMMIDGWVWDGRAWDGWAWERQYDKG